MLCVCASLYVCAVAFLADGSQSKIEVFGCVWKPLPCHWQSHQERLTNSGDLVMENMQSNSYHSTLGEMLSCVNRQIIILLA